MRTKSAVAQRSRQEPSAPFFRPSALAAVVIAAFLACTPTLSEPERSTEALVPQCDVDSDCGDRRACQLAACGVVGATRELSLSFLPPAVRADLAPQSVIGVTALTGSRLPDYAMQPAVAFSGSVEFEDAPGSEIFSPLSVVTLTPTIQIPGGAGTVSLVTDVTGFLETRLAPGRYDATVLLLRNAAPSQTFRSIVMRGSETQETLVMPSTASSLLRIDGRIDMPGVTTEQLLRARVTAVSPDGRATETSVERRPTAEPGVDEAGFRVFVDPDVTSLEFRIQNRDPDFTARFERIRIEDLTGDNGDDVQLLLPAEPELIPLTVDAVTTEGARPASGTLLWSQSLPTSVTTVATIPGVMEATILRREPIELGAGPFTTVVYAGEGRAIFTPDERSFGLPPSERVFADGVNDPVVSFDVPVRQRVVGWLEDPDNGEPTPNVLVSAVLTELPDGAPPSVSTGPYSGSVVADETGRFDLLLQPGRYEVFAAPAYNSSSAAGTRVELDVVQGEEVVWRIPAVRSGIVAGRLLDTSGEAVAGATVEAWPLDDTDTGPLARGVTDAAGEYRLILPVP